MAREKVDGRQEGSYQAAAGPLTQARGEVWAGAVSRRTDALEGAVGVGTDAALAEILLTALVHVCRTKIETDPPPPQRNLPGHAPTPLSLQGL